MKWYAYPVAIAAWFSLFVFLVAFAWHAIGDQQMATYWYYFPATSGILLLCAFILSRLKLDWELDVMIQVALFLAPVLWYVNQRDAYKQPVYVFMVEAGYKGDITVNFAEEKAGQTKVNSPADTLYFFFNNQGSILLREDFRTVREAMRNRFFYKYADGTRSKIKCFRPEDQLPADTTNPVLLEKEILSEKGVVKKMKYILDVPSAVRR